MEGRWQETLAGAPTIVVAERDATGRPNLERATTLEAGSPGVDVTLTIDASLQLAVEREVYAAWVADRAKSVSAVVMDPASGEILAEATYPSYDANGYAAVAAASPERFLDPVVAAVYEPGSVFKMVTAAAVLEAGVVKRTSRVRDQAVLRLDGGKAFVQNADKGSKGSLTFEDAVAWSRNVVMSKVALKLGRPPRRRPRCSTRRGPSSGSAPRPAWTSPARCPGIVRDPAQSTWRQIDVANGSFGQGVAVTLLQLATAYQRDGERRDPADPARRAARRRRRPSWPATAAASSTPALSADLVKIMRRVPLAVPFYRDRTLIPGYVVGGKTGTAQIWDGDEAALEGQRLQLLVRRLRRARGAPGRRRRRADRGGHADGPAGRPDRDAGRVVRALPARSPPTRWRRLDLAPVHRASPSASPLPRGPVSAACATLPAVTDRAGCAGRRRPSPAAP